jgi:hypothetical protein
LFGVLSSEAAELFAVGDDVQEDKKNAAVTAASTIEVRLLFFMIRDHILLWER